MASSGTGTNGKWHFMGDHANWQPYDPFSNQLLESAYQSGEETIDLSKDNYAMKYIVDLKSFTQRNKVYGTVREIKRDDAGTAPYSGLVSARSLYKPYTAIISPHPSSYHVRIPLHSVNPAPIPNPIPNIPISAHPPDYQDTFPAVPFSAVAKPRSGTMPNSIETTSDIIGTNPANSGTPYPPGISGIPPTSETASKTIFRPPKSGDISDTTGTVPNKSGIPNKSGVAITPPLPATSHHSGRPMSGSSYKPSTGSSSSLDSSPVPVPRNKTRSKSKHKHSTRYDTFFNSYTETKESDIPKDESCPICLTPLLEPADVDPPKHSISSSLPRDEILSLKKCSHMFHTICIGTMLDSVSGGKVNDLSISCPICQTIHGVKTGDQPTNGSMTVTHDTFSVPGHEGSRTITIHYNFSDGVTENGTRFHAASFPRVCYVPDNPEGRVVLELLRLAWKRRLIFTIGTSVTTGRANCVVWNNIHHKTEPHSNSSGHGFPDPNFLKNIKMELAVQGVMEEELK